MDKVAFLDFTFEVARRCDVLPRRWGVERTLGWMTRWRGLVRDYERRVDVSEAMIVSGALWPFWRNGFECGWSVSGGASGGHYGRN